MYMPTSARLPGLHDPRPPLENGPRHPGTAADRPPAGAGALPDGAAPEGLVEDFLELSRDPERMVRLIGYQVYDNSTIAVRKFRWAERALLLLLLAVVLLAATSVSIR